MATGNYGGYMVGPSMLKKEILFTDFYNTFENKLKF